MDPAVRAVGLIVELLPGPFIEAIVRKQPWLVAHQAIALVTAQLVFAACPLPDPHLVENAREVVERLSQLRTIDEEEMVTAHENITFKLPRQLA